MQLNLIPPAEGPEISLNDSFYSPANAEQIFQGLIESVRWHQEKYQFFGKTSLAPRLTAWYGDPGCDYQYSGIKHAPLPWTKELTNLRKEISAHLHHSFNSVLLNYYRDGSDYMGWHCDDESELGDKPIIASLSLGGERVFQLRKKSDHHHKTSLELGNGSLLVMSGNTQKDWQHRLSPSKRLTAPRINLSFRKILSLGHQPSSNPTNTGKERLR